MPMKKDDLLMLIRMGKPMTTRQQLHLTALLSMPAIMAQISSIIMQYIDASMVGSLGAALELAQLAQNHCEDRHCGSVRGAGFGSDREIFCEMFKHEARVEIAVEPLAHNSRHLETARRAGRDRIVDFVDVEPRRLRISKRLANSGESSGDCDLIACLGLLPRARAAFMHDVFAEHGKDRLQRLEVRLIASDENRQSRVASSDVAAGDGRIDRVNAARLRFDENLLGEDR